MKQQKRGLRLNSKSGWQKGGESGPAIAIVPGRPEESVKLDSGTVADGDEDAFGPFAVLGQPSEKEMKGAVANTKNRHLL